MSTAYRKELKYIIPIAGYMKLKSRLCAYMKPDENMHNGYYLVRSLYFDTLNDFDLYSSIFGFMTKSKIRLRIYPPNMGNIKLELKEKAGYDGMKTIVDITKEQAQAVMKARYKFLLEHSNKSALKIYEHLSGKSYSPKTIIEYKRTAFKHAVSNTRITFDYDIGASQNFSSFFKHSISAMPAIEKTEGILEIKYDNVLLGAIKDILKDIDNLNEASSKYAESRLLL